MSNSYLTVFIAFCFLIIIKLFYSSNKRKKINQKLTQPKISKKNKHLNLNDAFEKNTNQNLIEPIISNKNKWLYPSDEYGKMEKGTVYESKTYEREMIEKNIKYEITNKSKTYAE